MTILKNSRFKTIHLSFCFIDKNEKDAYSYRFLLARILTSYSTKYPTKKSLINAFSNLYGSYVSSKLNVMGQYSMLRFTMSFASPKFIDDLNYEDDIIDLIKDMLFDRKLFDEQIFNETKRRLIEQIETLPERKFEYARDMFLTHNFGNHYIAHPSYGTLEEVEKITVNDLYQYYLEHFLTNDIKIYATGDISESLQSKIDNLKSFERVTLKERLMIEDFNKSYTHHETKLPMGQSFIFLAYNLNINRLDKLYIPAILASLMLSGYPDSILFKEFREELGLAYEVDARFEYDKKYLFIFAGVNNETRLDSFQALKEIVERYIQNGPSEEMLFNAKKALINQTILAEDYQQSYIPKLIANELYQTNSTLENDIENIKRVTVSEVKEVLSMLKLTTSFIVEGENESESI
ncbi:M16 family metallopeptidase [Acholeplasma hippikon]|nr:insulinase family protein [Acholeplasma hippikon]